MTIHSIGQERHRKCPQGILESYLQYASHQESPDDFHTWVCISMMAAALGRNCYVSMGMWETFPNMYIVLVGESAITHKSTAIHMGTRMLRQALPEIEFLGDCMTAQALTSTLAEMSAEKKEAVGLIEGSELSVLLDNAKKDDILIKRLTDFWDAPDYRTFRTIGRGKEEITNICVNLIGGSTPKWLRSSVPEEALEGGFFSRLILVQRQPKGEKNSRPTVSPRQKEALENVKNDLQCIAHNMRGEFIVEPAAQNLFDEWYHEHNHPAKAQGFMRGYFGRKGDFMQKVAMCLSANYSDDMVITYDDMLMAHRLLNENEQYTEGLVKYMGTSAEGSKTIQILNTIKRSSINVPVDDKDVVGVLKKGITHRELQQKLSHKFNKDELQMALETLEAAGEIQMHLLPPRSKKAYVYLGTEGVEVE
jgi:hypothetical protein